MTHIYAQIMMMLNYCIGDSNYTSINTKFGTPLWLLMSHIYTVTNGLRTFDLFALFVNKLFYGYE